MNANDMGHYITQHYIQFAYETKCATNDRSQDQLSKVSGRQLRVGFLTYDLQRNTEDVLFEVARLETSLVKAFPLFWHVDQGIARVAFRPATARATHLGVDVKGSTPEGFMSNTEWSVGLECARQSDIVVLKGLFGLAGIWCALCARFLGRVVISINQTLPAKWERKRRWWVRLLKRTLLRMCHLYIYQNPASLEVLTEVYRCSPDRLIYAPFEGGASLFRGFIRPISTRNEARLDFDFDSRVIFLFVGNLVPFKGVVDIIKAAALLPRDASFLCVFVGPEEPRNQEGGTVEYFTRVARSNGVEHLVRFLKPVVPEKLAELYCAADVVLLPTRKDTFGKVLVEAGLAGKPLVTTNACGSAGLIVQDGVNGFVIEPGDPAELSRVMTKLLDPELRSRMGAQSRRIVDEHCRIDLEVQGYMTAIKRASEYLQSKENV
jgi:glycosyltransferase involved in cell wall biosynthesis